MYKTLNNHVAKFIIEQSVLGNPKFTFIRLYNASHMKEFTDEAFDRLYKILRKILLECHELEDILFAIEDCPLVVKTWLNNYVKQLKEQQKGGVKNE